MLACAFVAFLALPAVLALPFGGSECGSNPTEPELRRAAFKFATISRTARAGAAALGPTGPVPVYWHVITSGTTYAQGNMPLKHIEDGMDVLNAAYQPGGLTFVLANVTRIIDSPWFTALKNSPEQIEMKTRLRAGTEATLNIYSVNIPGLLGHATFPDDYDEKPKLDGVVLRFDTLPGGARIGSNFGITLVHEVGHWVGLYHTFQGGCAEPGDYVSDTPAAKGPAYGCDIGMNTCPGTGVDPVQNFMSYSAHECKTHFTPGQFTRMKTQISTFRGIRV